MSGSRRDVRAPAPVSLAHVLGWMRRGRGDRTVRVQPRAGWWATRTPDGPGTLALVVEPTAGRVRGTAWGPGASWLLDCAMPALLGAHDDASSFDPSAHPVVADAAHRNRGVRMGASLRVFEALVPAILEQKVTGVEARRSYAALVRRLGEPAPGPAGASGMVLPPSPEGVCSLTSSAFHTMGVEHKRAQTVLLAAANAASLEATAALGGPEARRHIEALPGVGPWTSAEVATIALGDPDAVSVGDYHLPNLVAWCLAGEARADDRRMLELLAPWAGHRGRVVRLLALSGRRQPRFGPRLAPRSIAAL